MNRLTAIGLASLVAYGVLIATKYVSVVSAARQDKPASVRMASLDASASDGSVEVNPAPIAAPRAVPFAAPTTVREPPMRASAVALEFRQARDLKAFADALLARKATLTADERYHLAKALEECQFATSLTEDIGAYAAKQRRQFIASLPLNDPNNAKRISAYEAVDNTQRCARFQGTKISQKDIDDLVQQAAQEGDPRAQARILVADLNKSLSQHSSDPSQPGGSVTPDDFSRIIGLLQTRDPEAMIIVGQFLAQQNIATQLRIGPNGEVPEPSAFLGAFSLVACDLGPDCTSLSREPQLACAYGGYCNSASFEELYQNFLASPWAYSQAVRYRTIIHTAINTQNWSLIGLQPPGMDKARVSQ